MTNRRDAILKEMGLTPIWKSRGQTSSLVSSEPPADFVDSEIPSTPSVAREARIAKMEWPELKAVVPSCTACSLHKTRKQTVFGVGDENADWLLVGEAPGAEEDQEGEPFVGQAGRLLDAMLA